MTADLMDSFTIHLLACHQPWLNKLISTSLFPHELKPVNFKTISGAVNNSAPAAKEIDKYYYSRIGHECKT